MKCVYRQRNFARKRTSRRILRGYCFPSAARRLYDYFRHKIQPNAVKECGKEITPGGDANF